MSKWSNGRILKRNSGPVGPNTVGHSTTLRKEKEGTC